MNGDDNSPWQYKSGGSDDAETADSSETDDSSVPSAQSFSWSAAEYAEQERGTGWYLMLALVAVVIAVVIYFVTKDYFAVGATVVAAIILGTYVGRKPNQVTYELTNKGIKIGQRTYSYSMFKSFSVFREGNLSSINFEPIKRLMPPISAYIEPQNEQKAIDAIGDHLPYEEHKLDVMDRLARRLRF